jgi:D-glycero-D-manno-heptose 1,7-bisphosphate phosphatase
MSRRALFLDRDGIVNELVFYPDTGEWEAPRRATDLKMRPDVAAAIRRASEAGWLVFLITNQPSFAKGKCTLESLQAVHARVLEELKRDGAAIAEAFVCFHHPESVVAGYGACECRKPSPFFIRSAAKKYDLDLAGSWMVGDQATDIETGRRAGCKTALVEYEHSESKREGAEPDLVCADLNAFVQMIVDGS